MSKSFKWKGGEISGTLVSTSFRNLVGHSPAKADPEGPTTAVLPHEVEQVWDATQNPWQLLELHCGENPDQLHLRLIVQHLQRVWKTVKITLIPLLSLQSRLRPQGPHPSPAQTVHTSVLRVGVQRREEREDLQIKNSFLPSASDF